LNLAIEQNLEQIVDLLIMEQVRWNLSGLWQYLCSVFSLGMLSWTLNISKEERDHALHIIRWGFCYEPEQRITATESPTDPSFNYIMGLHVV
jgi:hypothetical protein